MTQLLPLRVSSIVGDRRLLFFPTRRSSDLLLRVDVVVPVHDTNVRGMRRERSDMDAMLYGPQNAVVSRGVRLARALLLDRKSTRLNSSHLVISYAVFCLKK